MSKGPWRKTKRLMNELREADQIVKKEKELTERGYVPRSVAAASLRNLATDIAEGPENEWVRVEKPRVATERVK